MAQAGKSLIQKYAPGSAEKFGFHVPPFNSINHLQCGFSGSSILSQLVLHLRRVVLTDVSCAACIASHYHMILPGRPSNMSNGKIPDPSTRWQLFPETATRSIKGTLENSPLD